MEELPRTDCNRGHAATVSDKCYRRRHIHRHRHRHRHRRQPSATAANHQPPPPPPPSPTSTTIHSTTTTTHQPPTTSYNAETEEELKREGCPGCAKALVFVGSNDRQVYAMMQNNGTIVWKRELGSRVQVRLRP